MANKAAKSLAKRNSARLKSTHTVSIGLHALYILIHISTFLPHFIRPASFSWWRYILCSAPAIILEIWIEKIGRPKYHPAGGELKSSGEDLDAKGLTVWMWDVIMWTWACLVSVLVLGDWAWWFYALVPIYSIYAAYTTVRGIRSAIPGLSTANGPDAQQDYTGESRRQKKMETRGRQKVAYR